MKQKYSMACQSLAKCSSIVQRQSRIPGTTNSILDLFADPSKVEKLRRQLEEDGIDVHGDDKLLGLGRFSVVTHVARHQEGRLSEIIEGAVGRIDSIALKSHPIILQHAYERKYEIAGNDGKPYSFFIVPFAPDISEMNVTRSCGHSFEP